MRARLADAGAALRGALAAGPLRRIQLSWAAMITGEWMLIVTLGVWAFGVGGALAVGLVTLARTLPAAALGPLLASVADRRRRDAVLAVVSVTRVLLVAGIAAALVGGAPVALVLVLAAADAIAYSLFWPAQSALLAELARRPEELVAANVASTTIENLGALAGPALAAAALGLTSAGTTAALAALLLLQCAVMLFTLTRQGQHAPVAADGTGVHVAELLLGGVRHLARAAESRRVAALYLGHTLALGGLTVLVVVVALDALSLPESGVGVLTAAMGAGGVVGAVAALGLVGSARLGHALVGGVVAWGAATALLGAAPGAAPGAALAVGLLAAGGVANALVDVAALTLLQRLTPPKVLARVLGVVEGLWWASLGIGGIVASLLAEQLGVRGALVVVGVALGGLALASARALAKLDDEAPVPSPEVVEVLLADPILGPLPTAELERIALGATPIRVDAGEVIIREGDHGDRYYLIRDGAVEVTRDGLREPLGPGAGFGELALVLDVPRTATVTAREPTALVAVGRDDFRAALHASPASRAAVNALVAERLAPQRSEPR